MNTHQLHKEEIPFNATSIPLVRIGCVILFFIGLFPNLSLLGLDHIGSQPNDIIISLLLFPLLTWKSFPIPSLLLIGVGLFGFLMLAISPLDFNSFRSVINYLSLAFVPLVIYKALQSTTRACIISIVKVGIWIWFLVALIQYLFLPNFLSFLLPHQSGSLIGGRGVTSLATEPTYYGYSLCLLLVIVSILFEKKERLYYTIFLIFQLLILSISTTAIATLLLTLMIYFVFSSFKVRLILAVLAIPVGMLFYYYFYVNTSFIEALASEYRILNLAFLLVNNPEAAFVLDASGNRRFLAIFLSFKGFFDNWFMPHGFGNFNTYIFSEEITTQFRRFISFLRDYGRIQSSAGAILFELGFAGLIALLAIARSFLKLKSEWAKFAMILFMMILINPVPFTNSLVHVCIGLSMFLAYSSFAPSRNIANAETN